MRLNNQLFNELSEGFVDLLYGKDILGEMDEWRKEHKIYR
jgi:hypothetical protein